MFNDYVVTLDLAAIVIMVIILVIMFIRKLYIALSSKIFIITIFTTILTTIFDILSVIFFNDGMPLEDKYRILGAIFNTLYYVVRVTNVLLFLIYVLELTNSLRTILKSKLKLLLLFTPLLIAYILIIINPFTGIIFKVGIENDQYHFITGSFIHVLYSISVIYFIISAFYIIKNRYYFTKSQIFSLISILVFTLFSFVFQYLSTHFIFGGEILLVEMFTTSISIIFITSTIESSAELIDPKTGFSSYKEFTKLLLRVTKNKSKLVIYLIEINNLRNITNKMTNAKADKYISNICHDLNMTVKYLRCNAYSLDDAYYAITSTDISKTDKITLALFDECKTRINNSDIKLCTLTIPNDFDDYNSITKFIKNFQFKYKYINKIINYSDYKNDVDFNIINDMDIIVDNAISKKSLAIQYQPIFDTKSNKFNACEALVRIHDDKYGFIESKHIIDYAETTGKIAKIDEFVIEEAIKFIASDNFKKLNIKFVCVNISIYNCQDLNLYNKVVELINKYNIDPNKIIFEIIEGNEFLNHNAIYDTICKFNDFGIKFSLDNYGTGYSNIKNFSLTPIKAVKIDKVLVDNSNNIGMNYILKNTIDLIRSLGRKVVIEGIETEEKFNEFINYNPDYIQGFYYSVPLDEDEFIKFILGGEIND